MSDTCATCGTPLPGGAERCTQCGAPFKAEVLPARTPSRGVLVRDFLVFELKLILDGAMDVILGPIAAVVFFLDLVAGGPHLGRRFYRVLRFGERWDLWLSLYRSSQEAEQRPDGLFQAGAHSADSLIGAVEELMRDPGLPERYRKRLQGWAGSLSEKGEGKGSGDRRGRGR
ncbi:MAG: zinc ribbon domain-containing protein [Gemmatimonadota bacterium]